MLERITFATDFSEANMKVMEYLPQLKDVGVEEVIVVRVINLNRIVGVAGGVNVDEYIEECRREAEVKLAEVVSKIEEMGLRAKPFLPIPAGDPVMEIIKAAKESGSKMILMGSRGRGLIKEILLGSVSEGVVRKSDLPVFVIKHTTNVNSLFDRILYAHDLKEHSEVAMRYVRHIAERIKSEVILVHVVEKGEKFAKEKLKVIEEELVGLNFRTIIREGAPHKEILKVCEEVGATSIFIGGGIPETISEKLLGSTADAILRYSKVPVFVAKS